MQCFFLNFKLILKHLFGAPCLYEFQMTLKPPTIAPFLSEFQMTLKPPTYAVFLSEFQMTLKPTTGLSSFLFSDDLETSHQCTVSF